MRENQEAQNTITIPGKSFSFQLGSPQNATSRAVTTDFTGLANFDDVKHLLSDKPLRRPSRVRPLDESDVD